MLAAAGATLSACSPQPAPTPTPTAAFASEEEAFAAAEETYRAYNDAVNRQRDGDAATDPQDFLVALALDNDIDAIRLFEQNGLHIAGHGEIKRIRGTEAALESVPQSVEMFICLDVSATRVLNTKDEDVTPKDRADLVALTVEFTASDNGLMISDSIEGTKEEC